jgi:L-iditol 2-dehydrogenase
MTMRIAELIAARKFRIGTGQIPEPGPGEIQVRVEAVGICGSDMHSYSEGAVGDSPCRFPMVLGHEPAGVVVKTGPDVTGWNAGDRAAFEPAIYCYHCEYCRTGHHNVCASLRFLSQPEDPGFFREFVNLPVKNLIGIPNGLATRDATLIEPLAIAIHSLNISSFQEGETAVVFGAGPIGLVTSIALRVHGARRIWVVEPVAHRREMALRVAADAVIDPSAVDPAKQILEDTGKRGADLAIDCATKQDTINQCIHAVRNAGRVAVTGIPSELRSPVDFHTLRRKECVLFNVRRSNHESELALSMLTDHLDRFGPLVTHVRPLDRIADAFALVESYADGVGKFVISI